MRAFRRLVSICAATALSLGAVAAPAHAADAFPSDSCDGPFGYALVDAVAGGQRVHVAAEQFLDWTTAESGYRLCVRVDGAVSFGARIRYVQPPQGFSYPAVRAFRAGTCATDSGNVAPGPHPIESGAVGDPSDPSTYVPFFLDTYSDGHRFSVCVRAGLVDERVDVPLSADGLPFVDVAVDPAGSRDVPMLASHGDVTGTCRPDAGVGTQLFGDSNDARALLYAETQTPTPRVCVRVETGRLTDAAGGPIDVGGALTVDAAGAVGAVLATADLAADTTGCTLNVVSLVTPPVSVSRSATGVTPASVCVTVDGSTTRLTLRPPAGAPLPVTWSPDTT